MLIVRVILLMAPDKKHITQLQLYSNNKIMINNNLENYRTIHRLLSLVITDNLCNTTQDKIAVLIVLKPANSY